MRTRRQVEDHSEAVARRLAQLSLELAASREQARAEFADGTQAMDTARSVDEHGADTVPTPGTDTELTVEATYPGLSRWEAAETEPAPQAETSGGLPQGGVRLPVPGRHAARAWSIGRLGGGTHRWSIAHLVVVLGALCLLLAGTCLWLLNGEEEVAITAVSASPRSSEPEPQPLVGDLADLAGNAADSSAGTGGGAATGASSPPTEVAAEIVVDVAGKVRRPGIVVLPAGARVQDALEKAGGVRPGVDLTSLNLARPLVDGEQLLVGRQPAAVGGVSVSPNPTTGVAGAGGQSGGSAGAASPGAPVSLNSATLAELDTLPGVGPVTAQAIIDWRTSSGGFTSVHDLLEVRGVGEATLERLLPHVTL